MAHPVILHVAVVGFHHKKGCQVEFSYPSMSDATGEVPSAWQNLPSLALPDGAHNVDQDVIYFLLPSLENANQAVFGISCYRQMSAQRKVSAYRRQMAHPVILHVAVVGFHHKKGCQVEFSYPSMSDATGEVPSAWQNLPSLALPDGAHNVDQDVIYFLLPSLENANQAVFGISCYRQMSAQDLVNKSTDVTRSTVQKSVCVLTRVPLFGILTAKLQLITQVYFNERDFAKVEVLSQMYNNLCEMFMPEAIDEQAAAMDIPVRSLVTSFKHRLLALFKLILLERKLVVFYKRKIHAINFHRRKLQLDSETDATKLQSDEAVMPACNDSASTERLNAVSEQLLPGPATQSSFDSEGLLEEGLFQAAAYNKLHVVSRVEGVSENEIELQLDSETDATKLQSDEAVMPACNDSASTERLNAVSEQLLPGPATQSSFDSEENRNTVDGESGEPKSEHEMTAPGRVEDCVDRRRDEIGQKTGSSTELVSEAINETTVLDRKMTSGLNTDSYGFPLSIFTKGALFHPYLSISYLDMIRSDSIRAYCIGATNALFTQRRDSIDVIVTMSEDGEGDVDIVNTELRRALSLTAADLRFADFIIKGVDANGQSANWEGGDEWVRLQMRAYLLSLMATVRADLKEPLSDFNETFVGEWKLTNNYRIWSSGHYPDLASAVPGHPFAGGLGVSDVLLRVEHSIGGSEGGRRVVSAVTSTGKYFSDTGLKVKSSISSWLRGNNSNNNSSRPPS
ncbi:Late secretory pathway protein AVL9 -like protein [Toxocara canis]|uniref:Late secretory pathway protein AVL9-like protein n=1 Tax=Toxocara canis TaxID=6265 RepID=A0A0B2VDH1_TOXCA|nr:Late secretory pathway protein AVL9 -like protein [Toxocara canis]